MDKLRQYLENVVNVSWNFSGRLTSVEDEEQNVLIGLAAEAGEVLDLGKKKWFHSVRPAEFYREKLILELGDVLYYFVKALDVFKISLDEVMTRNREKLESRHPEHGKVSERFDGRHIR